MKHAVAIFESQNQSRLRTLLIVNFIVGIASAIAQPILPEGFAVQWHSTGWDLPLSIKFDETGKMYVLEKGGKLWIVENGDRLSEPMIDIHDEVGNWGD